MWRRSFRVHMVFSNSISLSERKSSNNSFSSFFAFSIFRCCCLYSIFFCTKAVSDTNFTKTNWLHKTVCTKSPIYFISSFLHFFPIPISWCINSFSPLLTAVTATAVAEKNRSETLQIGGGGGAVCFFLHHYCFYHGQKRARALVANVHIA